MIEKLEEIKKQKDSLEKQMQIRRIRHEEQLSELSDVKQYNEKTGREEIVTEAEIKMYRDKFEKELSEEFDKSLQILDLKISIANTEKKIQNLSKKLMEAEDEYNMAVTKKYYSKEGIYDTDSFDKTKIEKLKMQMEKLETSKIELKSKLEILEPKEKVATIEQPADFIKKEPETEKSEVEEDYLRIMSQRDEIEGISTSAYEMMSIEEKNDLLKQSKKEFITKYAMLFADKTDKQQDDIYNSLRGKLANELVDELRKNKTTPQISKQTQPAPAQSTPTQPQSANPTKTQAMTMDEASGKTEQDKSMIYEALKEKFDWNMEIERDFEGVTTPNKTGEIEGYYNDEIDENNINEQLEKHQIEGLNLETVKYIMENGDPAITAMLINEKEKLVEYYKLMTNNDYKDNSRLKIKYNLKEKLFSRIDRQTRKEIKEYAYKAREYAQIEAGPITKMQFKIKEMVEKSKQKRIEAKSNKYDKKFVKDYTKEKVQGPLTKQQETILDKKEQQQNKFKNLLKIEQGEIKLTSEGKEQTISRDNSPEHDSK